ncbi:MAG: chitobiase/beta-hexosaminidase C-terminal domain-containing protein [Opitutaceae bacterium]
MKTLNPKSNPSLKNISFCCDCLKQKLAIALGLAAASLLLPAKISAQCATATVGGGWQDAAMVSQTGAFTATFDATPSVAPTNAVVALSNGAQTAYANFACLARFNPSGDIDARNGGAYAAAATVPYSAGMSYHFRLVVNVSAQTYSIYVTPAGGSELTVGANFAFRLSATSLNDWGVYVDSGSGGAGSVTVCNFSLGGGGGGINYTITASAGAGGSISPLGAVSVAQGASQSYTITPGSGDAASVTVDGASVGAVTSYTFSNVQANHTINAAFSPLGGGGPVAAPTFSQPAGVYTKEVKVKISETTSGATIHYTTNGSTPTQTNGTVYTSGSIEFKTTTTLEAVAYTGSGISSVTSATYTFGGTPPPPQVAAPSFSPAPGTYTGAQSVSMATATSGASIRYTTDGSMPSETTGTLYSGPVSVGRTTNLQALAYKSGFTDSIVASAIYTINVGGSAPATPSGLAASATGTSTLSVTWNSSAGAASYDLQVDGSTITGVTSPYTSSGLAAGSTHTYAVRADNSFGDSAFSASISATTATASGSLTLGLMANPNGRYFSGYYPTWSDNWFTSLNNDGTLKTDNELYQASNFAQVPGVCTHVMAAFAQPNFAWSGINANSWSGTGLDFTAMPQDIKNIVRILHELNRKVILSVGGATYTNWSGLAAEAGKTGTPIKGALTQFLTDMGFDGLDVDFELTGADPASVAEYAQAIQAMAEAVNAAGPGHILSVAGWSTGADYTAATETDPGFPGVVSYWGGNAGRERQAFKIVLASGPLAGRTIASLFNLVNVMSYDAGYQHFDPVTAYNEYRALIASGASVGLGLEIPPEAWGGATLVLNNSDAGSAGSIVLMDQYNNTPRGPFSVQRFAGAVMSNTVNANPHDGLMLWDLLEKTSPTDANATSVPAYIAGLYGYIGVAP